MKKTFKIGEYAIGGIIAVEINKGQVKIAAKDWDTKAVIRNSTFSPAVGMMTIEMYLNDLTTCYYADKVMDYIKKSLTTNKNSE
jgi:hypothetical protein